VRFPRLFVGGFKPIKRPSFPVDPRFYVIRGHVNNVKPDRVEKRVIVETDTFVPLPQMDEGV
jgi:hypothetical protein